MPNLEVDKVEVYVFRRRSRAVEFLALRRAANRKLPGIWQPVTGKIELLETPVEAALREVREETGVRPIRLWRLEQSTVCLDARGRSVMVLPLLAAELPGGETIRLSKEHDDAVFVSAARAARLYLWDSQRRGLEAVMRQVLKGGALAAALEIPIPRTQVSGIRAKRATRSSSHPRRS